MVIDSIHKRAGNSAANRNLIIAIVLGIIALLALFASGYLILKFIRSENSSEDQAQQKSSYFASPVLQDSKPIQPANPIGSRERLRRSRVQSIQRLVKALGGAVLNKPLPPRPNQDLVLVTTEGKGGQNFEIPFILERPQEDTLRSVRKPPVAYFEAPAPSYSLPALESSEFFGSSSFSQPNTQKSSRDDQPPAFYPSSQDEVLRFAAEKPVAKVPAALFQPPKLEYPSVPPHPYAYSGQPESKLPKASANITNTTAKTINIPATKPEQKLAPLAVVNKSSDLLPPSINTQIPKLKRAGEIKYKPSIGSGDGNTKPLSIPTSTTSMAAKFPLPPKNGIPSPRQLERKPVPPFIGTSMLPKPTSLTTSTSTTTTKPGGAKDLPVPPSVMGQPQVKHRKQQESFGSFDISTYYQFRTSTAALGGGALPSVQEARKSTHIRI